MCTLNVATFGLLSGGAKQNESTQANTGGTAALSFHALHHFVHENCLKEKNVISD